ncbi:hypothetical protein DN402_33985 [Streptomyces sp. SW4]|nr:hypothetical protein DN402_33985 [Streptomyces sp. SW4]
MSRAEPRGDGGFFMVAVRGSDALRASQVRICSATGTVAGAGFLIAADVVCTCAHVVARALGTRTGPQPAPDEQVHLDFPLLGGRPTARATVASWRRGGADVALLRLDAPVEGPGRYRSSTAPTSGAHVPGARLSGRRRRRRLGFGHVAGRAGPGLGADGGE